VPFCRRLRSGPVVCSAFNSLISQVAEFIAWLTCLLVFLFFAVGTDRGGWVIFEGRVVWAADVSSVGSVLSCILLYDDLVFASSEVGSVERLADALWSVVRYRTPRPVPEAVPRSRC